MKHIIKQNYLKKYNKNLRGEVNNEPSMTVQDEAMTIQELIDRYRAGQRPDQKNFQYLDVEDIGQITTFYKHPGALDYTDLEHLSKSNADRIAQLTALQEKMQKEQKDIKAKAEADQKKELETETEEE